MPALYCYAVPSLFVLLWWLAVLCLCYIGVAMWVSIIIGAIIGWILRGILTKIGAWANPYRITHGQVITDIPIHFQTPLWRKFAGILLPVKPETLKAEIRYLYKDSDTSWLEALWKETKSPEITITEERTAHITVLNPHKDQVFTTEWKLLPNKFTLEVRLKRLSGTPRKHFEVPLVFEKGKLTKEGFIPNTTRGD